MVSTPALVPTQLPRGLSGRGMTLTTELHLVPRSRMVELYLHSPIRLHGVVLTLPATQTIRRRMIGTRRIMISRGYGREKLRPHLKSWRTPFLSNLFFSLLLHFEKINRWRLTRSPCRVSVQTTLIPPLPLCGSCRIIGK
jgi:hypothetical protein